MICSQLKLSFQVYLTELIVHTSISWKERDHIIRSHTQLH